MYLEQKKNVLRTFCFFEFQRAYPRNFVTHDVSNLGFGTLNGYAFYCMTTTDVNSMFPHATTCLAAILWAHVFNVIYRYYANNVLFLAFMESSVTDHRFP